MDNKDLSVIENTEKKGKKSFAKTIKLSCAVAALVVVALLVNIFLTNRIPKYNTAVYNMQEITEIFTTLRGTSTYEDHYAPSSEYLYLNEITDEDYLPLLNYSSCSKNFNKKEFSKFNDSVLRRFFKAAGKEMPEYEIKDNTDSEVNDQYECLINYPDDIYVYSLQEKRCQRLYISKNSNSQNSSELLLNGKKLEIDISKSDEEIIKDFNEFKETLFYIMGVEFSDVKVIRYFYEFSKTNIPELITLVFYNKDAHLLNEIQNYPITDYILVSFENSINESQDIVTDFSSIIYYKNRVKMRKYSAIDKFAKKLPLEKAEEYLNKGYVLANGCPICMSNQEEVDFSNYDYVEITYYHKGSDFEPECAIPLYAFYKYIGTKDGYNNAYAVTYVPAVSVEGYEEYFLKKEAEHENEAKY